MRVRISAVSQLFAKAGDPVWVKVQVSINAIASGGGSYAEMNFSDGAANYIEPLFLAAQAL